VGVEQISGVGSLTKGRRDLDLFDVARSCFRRWYFFLPLLLIVAWYSHSVYSSAKPVYYSNAVIGLAPPSTRVDQVAAGAQVPRNGLLDTGGATLVANLAAVALRQPSVVNRVVAAGGAPDYVVYLMPSPGGGQLPIINIDVTNADANVASRTQELVIGQADGALETLQLQARVPEDQIVKTFVVSPPKAPTPGMPSRTRSTIAVFVAGLGLSVLLVVLADVLLGRRRKRIGVRRQAPPADGPDPDRKRDDAPQTDSVAVLQDTALDSG
jgi:hypothetical protein